MLLSNSKRQTWVYVRIVAIVLGSAALLIPAINGSQVALMISGALALIAAFDPPCWFAFIAASQVVPDPALAPLSLAQQAALAWVVATLIRSLQFGASRSDAARLFFRRVAPLVFWVCLCDGVFRQTIRWDLLLGPAIGWMSVLQASDTRRRYDSRLLLFALIAGCATGIIGFWAMQLGIPVIEASESNVVLSQRLERTAIGRGNVNMVGLSMPLCLVGIIALTRSRRPRRPFPADRASTASAWAVGLVAFFVGVPPLLATLSRGPLYSLIGALALLLFLEIWVIAPRHALVKAALIAVTSAFVLAFPLWDTLPSGIQQRLEQLKQRNAQSVQMTGDSAMLAGRLSAWEPYLTAIARYPFTGLPNGERWDFKQFGIITVGKQKPPRQAHNTYLEYGASGGVPAVIFVFAFAFAGCKRLVRTTGWLLALPFVVCIACVLLNFMSISGHSWKTWWALSGLLYAAAPIGPRRRPRPACVLDTKPPISRASVAEASRYSAKDPSTARGLQGSACVQQHAAE